VDLVVDLCTKYLNFVIFAIEIYCSAHQRNPRKCVLHIIFYFAVIENNIQNTCITKRSITFSKYSVTNIVTFLKFTVLLLYIVNKLNKCTR